MITYESYGIGMVENADGGIEVFDRQSHGSDLAAAHVAARDVSIKTYPLDGYGYVARMKDGWELASIAYENGAVEDDYWQS